MVKKWIRSYKRLRTVHGRSEIVKITFAKVGNKIRNTVYSRMTNLAMRVDVPQKIENWDVKMILFPENFLAGSVRGLSDPKKKRILMRANKVCDHVFDLLGSGDVALGWPLPWHTDFKTGYVWAKKYYKDIEKEMMEPDYFNNPADIKIPWELSRFQHLIPLGQAYQISNDPKYYQEFKAQIEHWIQDNPYRVSANWACTMDVAIRAVNWIVAYGMFKDLVDSDAPFRSLFFRSLYQKGLFIEGNLECNVLGEGNNHYLSNLAGLVFVGLFFKGLNSRTSRWLTMGTKGIEEQIIAQVYSDGGSFEGSISYHRLAAEIFLNCDVFLERNGCVLSLEYRQRLEKMMEFTRDYMKPGGNAPQFGDADDGRFIIWGDYGDSNKEDHRHLLSMAGVRFDREDFKSASEEKNDDARWFYGSWEGAEVRWNPKTSASYPETGMHIFRDGPFYMCVKCGLIGQKGTGGHDHNDQMSFELNFNGYDVIVDSGTYVYSMDPRERQRFRSTEAHNVPQFDRWEQNVMKADCFADLFCSVTSEAGQVLECRDSTDVWKIQGLVHYVEAEHTLNRTIVYDKIAKSLTFSDFFQGNHLDGEGKMRVHLSKEIEAIEIKGTKAMLKIPVGMVVIEANEEILQKRCKISDAYGTCFESWVLEWKIGTISGFRMTFEGDNYAESLLHSGS